MTSGSVPDSRNVSIWVKAVGSSDKVDLVRWLFCALVVMVEDRKNLSLVWWLLIFDDQITSERLLIRFFDSETALVGMAYDALCVCCCYWFCFKGSWMRSLGSTYSNTEPGHACVYCFQSLSLLPHHLCQSLAVGPGPFIFGLIQTV